MKVYLVSFIVDEVDSVPHKIFKNKNKAEKYIDGKNETSEHGWYYQEMEVVE